MRLLLSRPAIPGWILLGWTMLSHASTAEFALALVRSWTFFLNRNPVYGLVLGFGWLSALLFWPKVNSRVPWLSSKTSAERLDDVEKLLNGQGGQVGYRPLCLLVDNTIEKLNNAKKKLEGAEVDLQNHVQRITSLETESSRLHDGGVRQAVVIARIDNGIGRIRSALKDSTALHRYMLDMTRLLWEAQASIKEFNRIREMYGDRTPVVRQPLSSEWRLPPYSLEPPADDSIRDGEKWARALEEHIDNFQDVVQGWTGMYPQNGIITIIKFWRKQGADLSADELLKRLSDHVKDIAERRNSYAASLIDGWLAWNLDPVPQGRGV